MHACQHEPPAHTPSTPCVLLLHEVHHHHGPCHAISPPGIASLPIRHFPDSKRRGHQSEIPRDVATAYPLQQQVFLLRKLGHIDVRRQSPPGFAEQFFARLQLALHSTT
eukprot:11285157-Prorocentrum_lima.AAC.1